MVEEQVLTQTQKLAHEKCVVEIVSDLDRFNAIEPAWNGLVDRSGVDRVFLSHTWFRTWWECFGQGKQLHIITIRNGGELVAAAPMMRLQASLYGLKLDTIQAIYNPHTPRYDFIVGAHQDPWLYRTIWNEIASQAAVDAVILTQIPESSRTIEIVEQIGRQDGWLTGRWSAPASPFIPLNEGYDAFLGALKGGVRYNLRKRYERLQKLGTVDVEVISNPAEVQAAMGEGLQIEAAAWKGKEGTAIVSDPAVAEFYLRLATREADLGRLQLAFLRLDGKRISFNYLLRSESKLYGVKIGYDPQYHTYSPGNMLLNLILKQACSEGVREYDFLGVDDSWKFEWTKDKRDHRWLFLFRDRLTMRFLHRFKFTYLPAVKAKLTNICTYLPGRA